VNVIGLDIGGANLKASNGNDWTAEAPFPMWKHPDKLGEALRSLTANRVNGETVLAVTMTGELADCFRTKSEGVHAILDAVDRAFPQAPELRVWQTGGEFFTLEEALEFPILVAAANWHAQATWAGRACPEGAALLIDTGSTTTDIIPLWQGTPVAEGGTDPLRLRSGELVYTGVRRTPLMALSPDVNSQGKRTGVAAELFATTRDLYLWTGESPESPDDCETANGRPATREWAYDRLTRMLCADRDEISPDRDRPAGQTVDRSAAEPDPASDRAGHRPAEGSREDGPAIRGGGVPRAASRGQHSGTGSGRTAVPSLACWGPHIPPGPVLMRWLGWLSSDRCNGVKSPSSARPGLRSK
jgi:probable H4MPT-linked C1 transfer pathway protein